MDSLKEYGPLFSFIAEGLILFDEKGLVTLANPHANLLLDYTGGEMLGKHIDEVFDMYIDEEVVPRENKVMHAIFELGKPFVVPAGHTMYFQSKSGRKYPVFASAKTLALGGVPQGALVFRDITTEKALENYKKNTAEILSRLTPVLQKTATGDFSVNIPVPEKEDEFTELMVGLSLMMEDLREIDRNRQKTEEEKFKAVEDKRKITEQYSKELEKTVEEKTSELNKTKIHIETVIENLTSGLIEYDSDFTIMRINYAAEEMLGLVRGSVVGKKIKPEDTTKGELESLARVSYPGLVPGVRKLSKDVSGLNAADVHEIMIRQPFEKELQVITAPIISPQTGEMHGFIKVIRDVTREKMISKSKSEFISIAAHQLRTPLSAVKWAMKLVIDGDMGPLNPEQLQFLMRGYETNQKMISLVNDLLNVARIEDGRFGYAFKEANMMEVVNMIINSSKLASRERDVDVELRNSAGDLKPFVFDAEKMSLAVQNLLDNALKYTNPGGKVVLDISVEGDYLKMKVSDNGVGVPKNQLTRLFSKFFRAENVIHLQTSGSGLGLFIVKNIITRHGGDITVESEEGKGTTFTFVIPTKEALIPVEEKLTYY
ncbi:MAG: hypothetical protein A2937_01030 [Candidatus Yonathbacteria bacterium RIFCSPLOWO2_01_FULL_47_33b]|uniref:histidine kinase n=1 Tax=Candidatus Yonathbacteria bacterium RIFCSPLOWO2_01_FULL_47_33b TaxID=1802727 RepID=A0A1G2SFB4_9BACT|nr:MAG: hypothetical protein A2937_01030 [Candidatus Yonathbacteria bacterium RIFCSPLOWO2_01_FULL_47_33b]